jgi:hypothetical protein
MRQILPEEYARAHEPGAVGVDSPDLSSFGPAEPAYLNLSLGSV